LVLISLVSLVKSEDYSCPSGKSTKTITVKDGDSFSFNSNPDDADNYENKEKCTVKYKRGGSCKELKFECQSFNLQKGDKLIIGKNKYFLDEDVSETTTKKVMKVRFISNKKKTGSGAQCTIECSDPEAPGVTETPSTTEATPTPPVLTTPTPAPTENVVINGDFETGSIDPWYSSSSSCEVNDENDENYLVVSNRKEVWSGPRQFLNVSYFKQDPLKFNFKYSIKADVGIDVVWKLKGTNGVTTKYFVLHQESVDTSQWTDIEQDVVLNSFLKQATEITLYLEVTPSTTDYYLDDVALEWTDPNHWKQDVDAKIDALRKKDLTINFAGIDATKLELEFTQLSHKYPFGHAVQGPTIADCQTSGVDNNYCSYMKNNFNWVVDTYRMKFRAIEPNRGEFVTEIADLMIDWAQKNNLTVRGHSLLWSKKQNNPSWTWSLFGDEFEEVIYKHIDDTLNHFNTKGVIDWDVINEMVDQGGVSNHTYYMDQSGNPNIRAEIHKHIKQNFPQNKQFVNDYGIILDRNNRFSMFQDLLRDLIASGAPIDGIGLQSHINGNEIIDWNLVKENVEALWAEFQIPMWVTEFDWNGDENDSDVPWGDHSQHAQILEDFYKLMFSQEGIFGIVAWKPTTLNSPDYLPNKAGEAYMKLYHEEWRSSAVVVPSSSDVETFRGFEGDYRITMKKNGDIVADFTFPLVGDSSMECVYVIDKVECN